MGKMDWKEIEEKYGGAGCDAIKKKIESRINNNYPNDTDTEKKYCVIYRNAPWCGIFSHISSSYPAINFAEKNGLYPIFDTRDVEHWYKPESALDWWELYFQPLSGYTLDDIDNMNEVIVIDAEEAQKSEDLIAFDDEMLFANDPEKKSYLRKIFKKYIKLKPEIEKYINEQWEKICGNGNEEGFLGVRSRGTGYKVFTSGGLTVFDDDSLIKKVSHILDSGDQFDKIFLATDDSDTIDLFKEHFSPKILYYISEDDRINIEDIGKYIETKGAWNAQIGAFFEHTTDKYRHTLNYITEIMLLQRCSGVISNKCSASMILPLLKDDWLLEYYY